MDIPKFKRKVNGFMLEEDASVTKLTILKAGAIISLGLFSGVLSSNSAFAGAEDTGKAQLCDAGEGTAEAPSNCYSHNNDAGMGLEEGNLISAHKHHYNHGSHASHGSHGSHSSCCLAPGTKISMADGTTKVIEDISIGDEVVSFDNELNEIVKSRVEELISPEKEEIYNINNGLLEITEDHPMRIKRDAEFFWAAINVEMANLSYDIEGIQKLEKGDHIVMINGNGILSKEVTSIEIQKKQIKTYTFKTDKYHNYFANKVMVHNTGGCGGMM